MHNSQVLLLLLFVDMSLYTQARVYGKLSVTAVQVQASKSVGSAWLAMWSCQARFAETLCTHVVEMPHTRHSQCTMLVSIGSPTSRT